MGEQVPTTSDAIGIIRYRYPTGEEHEWAIGAHASEDNEETLRKHLLRWRPGAEFISGEVRPR